MRPAVETAARVVASPSHLDDAVAVAGRRHRKLMARELVGRVESHHGREDRSCRIAVERDRRRLVQVVLRIRLVAGHSLAAGRTLAADRSRRTGRLEVGSRRIGRRPVEDSHPGRRMDRSLTCCVRRKWWSVKEEWCGGSRKMREAEAERYRLMF